jgi:hypothetical protein
MKVVKKLYRENLCRKSSFSFFVKSSYLQSSWTPCCNFFLDCALNYKCPKLQLKSIRHDTIYRNWGTDSVSLWLIILKWQLAIGNSLLVSSNCNAGNLEIRTFACFLMWIFSLVLVLTWLLISQNCCLYYINGFIIVFQIIIIIINYVTRTRWETTLYHSSSSIFATRIKYATL